MGLDTRDANADFVIKGRTSLEGGEKGRVSREIVSRRSWSRQRMRGRGQKKGRENVGDSIRGKYFVGGYGRGSNLRGRWAIRTFESFNG